MRPVVTWRFNTWIWYKRCIVIIVYKLRMNFRNWKPPLRALRHIGYWFLTSKLGSKRWQLCLGLGPAGFFQRWILDVSRTRQVVRLVAQLVSTRTCSKASFRAGAVSCNQLWRAWALSFQATTYRDGLNVHSTAIKSSSIQAGSKMIKRCSGKQTGQHC